MWFRIWIRVFFQVRFFGLFLVVLSLFLLKPHEKILLFLGSLFKTGFPGWRFRSDSGYFKALHSNFQRKYYYFHPLATQFSQQGKKD